MLAAFCSLETENVADLPENKTSLPNKEQAFAPSELIGLAAGLAIS